MAANSERLRMAAQAQLTDMTRDHDRLRMIIQDLESEKDVLSNRLKSDTEKILRLESVLSEYKSRETYQSQKVCVWILFFFCKNRS